MELRKGGDPPEKASRFPLRWIDFYIKHYAMVTAAVTIVLLCIIMLLGWLSGGNDLLEAFAIIMTIATGLFVVVLLRRWSFTVSRDIEVKTKQLDRSVYLY